MARINPDCAELENFVRKILADKNYVADLSEADRISMFGEMFAKFPSKFTLMPGEKALIADVVDTAQKMTFYRHQDAKERVYAKERLPSVHQYHGEKKITVRRLG